jgi:O-6-methylguanine DNA methyltransferase
MSPNPRQLEMFSADAAPRDPLDDLLAAYFRPGPPPGDLVRRIVRDARDASGALRPLAARLAIRATERGVSLVAPERSAPPRGAATRRSASPDGGASGRLTGPARRLIERARREVQEYLDGRRSFFTVPVDLTALPAFQRRVLEEARRIPFGQARTYAWVARRIGNPRAVRAVGTALARNPVPLIVPCHRVLRSDGGLGGYSMEGGVALKARLLALEQAIPPLEGCSTTGIVCRAGCTSGRRMRPDRCRPFDSLAEARSAGFRPCKSCRPAAAA